MSEEKKCQTCRDNTRARNKCLDCTPSYPNWRPRKAAQLRTCTVCQGEIAADAYRVTIHGGEHTVHYCGQSCFRAAMSYDFKRNPADACFGLPDPAKPEPPASQPEEWEGKVVTGPLDSIRTLGHYVELPRSLVVGTRVVVRRVE